MIYPPNIIAIWGVPRSGTTWLGQIFNSSPQTMFRYQPLFSYEFKGTLTERSNTMEIELFFYNIAKSNNDFILYGLASEREKSELNFSKYDIPTHLVMKHVRYHNIIENTIKRFPRIKIIAIIRNPCATINSWINAPKEFDYKWEVSEEWYDAKKKNSNRKEEFFGFYKWKEATKLYHTLKNNYPENVYLLKYTDLMQRTLDVVGELFNFSRLPISDQTKRFIIESSKKNDKDAYSVFRQKTLDDLWKLELNQSIIDSIHSELSHTELETYLDD